MQIMFFDLFKIQNSVNDFFFLVDTDQFNNLLTIVSLGGYSCTINILTFQCLNKYISVRQYIFVTVFPLEH